VLPRPAGECTLALELDQAQALEHMASLARGALPLAASCWFDGQLYLRFEGSLETLDAVAARVGGELLPDCGSFWASLREQTHPFFAGEQPLWRCTVPGLVAPLPLGDVSLVEWNGMQRWYRGVADTAALEATTAVGGHATLFRHHTDAADVFTPLAPPLLRLHRELKRVFDPAGILNPGRMYADL